MSAERAIQSVKRRKHVRFDREPIAPEIRRREQEIARLEVRLKAPPPQQPRLDELRATLLQRADWKKKLRTEPQLARVLLRRMIGPFVLNDESEMPDFIKADCEVKNGLLDDLGVHLVTEQVVNTEGASPASTAEMYELPIAGDLRKAA